MRLCDAACDARAMVDGNSAPPAAPAATFLMNVRRLRGVMEMLLS
jgi:hypothetical protein